MMTCFAIKIMLNLHVCYIVLNKTAGNIQQQTDQGSRKARQANARGDLKPPCRKLCWIRSVWYPTDITTYLLAKYVTSMVVSPKIMPLWWEYCTHKQVFLATGTDGPPYHHMQGNFSFNLKTIPPKDELKHGLSSSRKVAHCFSVHLKKVSVS